MTDRQTGVFSFADNFECSLSAPLDARMTTPLKSQLTGFTGMYLGMLVVVTEDTDSNNGLYRLKENAGTSLTHWEQIGTGGSISVATSNALGGVKIGYTKSGTNYPVELDAEKAYVNVSEISDITDLSTNFYSYKSTNDTAVNYNTTTLTALLFNYNTYKTNNNSAVATNSTAISNNATNITANATAISNNTTNITANATAISNNTTNITTNSTAITNLQNAGYITSSSLPSTNQLVPTITNDGYFLRSDDDGSTQSLSWVSLPSNIPNFHTSINGVTDGHFLKVATESGDKVVKYESVTIPSGNQLVPTITTDGYFLRSDNDGTTQSLTWAEISIPTDNSSLTNGANYITASSTDTLTNKTIGYSQISGVPSFITASSTDTLTNKTMSYSQLTGTPSIPDVSDFITASSTDTLTNKSMSYSQLTGTPSIPDVSDFITASSTDTLTNKSMSYSQLTGTPTIPTNNNELTNGENFITKDITNQVTITSDTSPQLTIKPSSDSSQVGTLRIEGRRTTGLTSSSSAIEFYNYDSGLQTSSLYGRIVTRTESSTANVGKMRFQVSATGSNSTQAVLDLTSDRRALFLGNTDFANIPTHGSFTLLSTDSALNYNKITQNLPTEFNPPEATSSVRGGIKIGYVENGKNYPVELSSEKAFVNVPWSDTAYILPTASSSTLGGIQIGSGLNMSGNTCSVDLSSFTYTSGIQLKSDIHTDGGANDDPNLLVTTSSVSGFDSAISIRGSRNGSTTSNQANLLFENYDSNLNSGTTHLLGKISGRVTNAGTNVGDMVFYSSTDGSATAEAMRVTRTNTLKLTGELERPTNAYMTEVGTYQANTTNIGGANGPRYIAWNNSTTNEGLTHTGSSSIPTGSLWTKTSAGQGHYRINVVLGCDSMTGTTRSVFCLYVYTYSGATSTLLPGTDKQQYFVGNGYGRAFSNTNKVRFGGTIDLYLNQADQFEIVVDKIYGGSQSANLTANVTQLIVERIH